MTASGRLTITRGAGRGQTLTGCRFTRIGTGASSAMLAEQPVEARSAIIAAQLSFLFVWFFISFSLAVWFSRLAG